MDEIISETLTKIQVHLDEDLARLKLTKNQKKHKRSRSDFMKYLISVASHPVGLRASIKPFNSDQEHMLVYVMDLFSIDRSRLTSILKGSRKNRSPGWKTPSDLNHVARSADPLRRHSWRPEIRLSIQPPSFFYDEINQINRLQVRVYLFRDTSDLDDGGQSQGQDVGTNILDRILKKYRIKNSSLIRPVDEMKRLIRFSRLRYPSIASGSRQTRQLYQMVVTLPETAEQIKNDIFLRTRRSHCDPQSNYILRLEFWLDSHYTAFNLSRWFRNKLRRYVFNKSNTAGRSTYMNEENEFYGFTNVKLSHIPAYAIRQSFPILSLSEKRINNCELSLEFRNSRVQSDGWLTPLKIEGDDRPKKSLQSFIINHIRLYANCLLYSCLPFSQRLVEDFQDRFDSLQGVTLDNLLHIPALTLINQHRLQSNLSRFEDLCLRRLTLLVLLMKLDKRPNASRPMIAILTSALQSEYQLSDKPLDDSTKQNVDPFRDASILSASLSFLLEESTLRTFVATTLIYGLERWPKYSGQTRSNFKLFCTLSYLRLVKFAITYYRKVDKTKSNKKKITFGNSLSNQVNEILCRVIAENLKERFLDMAKLYHQPDGNLSQLQTQIQIEKNWFNLLRDLRFLNYDICTFWSKRGLDGVISSCPSIVTDMDMFQGLNETRLREAIKTKAEMYSKPRTPAS